jgi:hypothetical protein
VESSEKTFVVVYFDIFRGGKDQAVNAGVANQKKLVAHAAIKSNQ